MKKVICLCASALLLGSGSMFAQGEMDAYKFSQYDLNGTVVTISELLYIAKPAGLVLMAEISPPNAPKAPPIDK